MLAGVTLGVIGVGTISSACVRGLLGGETTPGQVVLSPRNEAKAAALRREFPAAVRIAESNQAVVDAADVVLVAVLAPQLESVLSPLLFRQEQSAISLVAGVDLETVTRLAAPAREACIAVPLPIVAQRRGVTLMLRASALSRALFEALGSTVCVDDEEQFRGLQCVTCVMGDLYERQRTVYEWLAAKKVPRHEAAAYVGGLFHTMTADAESADADTFRRLVDEQTPGGMNQMVIAQQRADRNYDALRYSLDALDSRLAGDAPDPALEPTFRRRLREYGGDDHGGGL